jgi:hypothetical protein
MIPSLLDRWRRRLDLDQIRPKRGVLDDQVSHVFEFIDDGSRRSIELLLRYIMLQALVDRVIGVHFFLDEDDQCVRMLYCLAVPADRKQEPITPSCLPFDGPRSDRINMIEGQFVQPDPTNPAYERIWYEMIPPPAYIATRLFDRIRWYARLVPGMVEGTLSIRVDGRNVRATVVAPRPDDIRVFFGAERPPIRPKLKRHFDEVGLPQPG